MKKIILLLTLFSFCLSANSAEAKYVKGYRKSNGTYVKAHYRTKADNKKSNNYSAKGNRTPSGKKGYKKRK